MKNKFLVWLVICFFLCLTTGFFGVPADAGNTGTVVISGTIPLLTFNVSVAGIGADNATITWNTNGGANSTVEYGTSTGYGSTSTEGIMTTSHTIQLNSLSSFTVYHYRVISTTNDGQSVASPDATFKTLYPVGTIVTTFSEGTIFTGVNTTTVAGVQQVNLTLSGSRAVSGNTVTDSSPGNGWSSLQYTGTDVINDGQNISISGVQNVVMQSTPVTADLGGNIGTVSSRIDIALTQLVSGVTIQQNVIQGATAPVASAFQFAATNNNLDVRSVAYTVEFQNAGALDANLGSAGVTLELGIDHDWVVENAPGGDRNNIRILRFGDDGTKEVLSTQFTGSQGSTDYFTASSPHGLSTFGMAAVASTGSSSSGSSSSTGSTSTGSTSAGSSIYGSNSANSWLGSLLSGPQAVQQPSVPVVPPVVPALLAPPESAATITRSLTVPGLTVTTGSDGKQAISLDTRLAEQSGSKISLEDTIITISQPGFSLTIITRDAPTTVNGVISGSVKAVMLRTAPAYAATGVGTVSVALDTPLAAIPEGATITITIPQTVNSDVLGAFQSAEMTGNRQIGEIAYVVYIRKTNVITTGTAMVALSISPGWVTNHGGTGSIGIAHLSDEGTSSIIRTDYTGSDDQGNMEFKGTSPEGLSTFGLVSLKNLTGTAQAPVETPASSQSSLLPVGLMRNLVLVIGGVIILMVIGTGVILYDLRFRKKNRRTRKKEQ
jgi:hypothetical protein